MNPIVLTEQYQTEMRGNPIDVPLASGIDYNELIAGDPNPMFVTLAVGAAGAASRNMTATGKPRRYPRAVEEAVVRTVNEQKPTGIRGHLRSEARSYDNPPAVWRAVGAMLDEAGTTWVKFYVLPTATDVREEIRTAKATNAPVGLSRYATGYVDAETGEVQSEGYTLEGIDYVNAARVGIVNTSQIPHVTAEAHTNHDAVVDNHSPEAEPSRMDTGANVVDAARVNETDEPLSINENKDIETAMPDKTLDEQMSDLKQGHAETVRDLKSQIIELQALHRDHNRLVELLNLKEGDDAILMLQAVLSENTIFRRENQELLEASIAAEVNAAISVVDVRPLVIEMVREMQPTTKSEVQARVRQVCERESVKRLVKSKVSEMMGEAQKPNADAPSGMGESDNSDNPYELIWG